MFCNGTCQCTMKGGAMDTHLDSINNLEAAMVIDLGNITCV